MSGQMSHQTKQRELLKAIRAFQKTHGKSPTIRQLAAVMPFKSIQYHLECMEAAGILKRDDYSREIILLKQSIQDVGIDQETLSKMRTVAGRKGRGADINSGVKADAVLEARIQMVVRAALRSEQAGANGDVVRGGDHIIRLNGLRASRIG
jgi:SOS-response transcriptional repressor LexA